MTLQAVPLHAGAWGHGSFENDDAMDWTENDLRPSGQRAVENALQALLKNARNLQAMQCSYAIAACEVLAAAQGRAASDLPTNVLMLSKKLSAKQSESLRNDARKALEMIAAKSELRDLWAASPDFKEWTKAIEALRGRL